jgi:ABC-2 type transport system permease protein
VVWRFVAENLLNFTLPDNVARFLPLVAGNHPTGVTTDLGSAMAAAGALTRAQNALVFAAYTAVAAGLALALLCRRDTS